MIAGPTASGKSALAVRIANLLGGAVVNADSMQVYRDIEILTARPDPASLAAAPHRLFGHVDGGSDYSVGHWLEDVRETISVLRAKNLVPVIAGGTGLYFKALTDGLAEMPVVRRETRERWRMRLQEEGASSLHGLLRRLDPEMASRLRPSDGQRIVRALEVLEDSGRSILDWQRTAGQRQPLAGGSGVRIVLQTDRAVLRKRIADRFDRMMQCGALREVEILRARGLHPDKTIMKAIGVSHLLSHLSGDASLEEAVARAKVDSGRYAKRQDTWFRNQMAEDWWRVAMP